jgi:hypothetical protein
MTMPLPMRLMGIWGDEATHPRIAKFRLTDEQIAQEAEFNAKLIEKALADQKELPQSTTKGGWTPNTMDVNRLRSAVLGGGGSPYGGMGMGMGMGMMGGMTTPTMPMPTMGAPTSMMSGMMRPGVGYSGTAGGAHGSGGARGRGPKVEDKLGDLLKLESDEKRREALQKYVTEIASAEGELLLFRYLDFGVEPGRTYRYRARLTFRNPNFLSPASQAVDPTVVEGETRKSDWSEPTMPVAVEGEQEYFVASIKQSPSKPYSIPRLGVYQWDSNLGTTQHSLLDIPLGQTVSGKERTKVLDPAKNTFEEKNYAFLSTDFVVDALPDISVDSAVHPDIAPLGGATRGDLKLNEEVLVATADGDLKLLDPGRDAAAEKEAAQNLKYQNQPFEDLLAGPDDEAAGNDLLGEGMSTMPGGMMSGSMMMMMGNRMNPLGKGPGKRGRSKARTEGP